MSDRNERARHVAGELTEPVREAGELARKLGLDPYPVNYWVVDYDEMNELIAYGGFQTRYPHWRWGMQYDRQRKQGQFGLGKAFEIVNNDDPSNAFLQESNSLADQKAVITHVEAHADFFRNNEWFGLFGDDLDAAAMLERHADVIGDHMSDPEIDREDVERFVDAVLSLEDTIDQHRSISAAKAAALDERGIDAEDVTPELDSMDLSAEVRNQVFDEAWLDDREETDADAHLDRPRKDVLAYLRHHGRRYDDDAEKAVEREEWENEVFDALRTEAYYFAAQKMTKVMNEGWACVAPDTRVFTSEGVLPMEEVVADHTTVSDGETPREVYDSNVIPDHDTITVTTRRGFELTGSNNHRIRRPDGSWIRLDELTEGDSIAISGGDGTWPDEYVGVKWDNPDHATLNDVAEEAGVSVWTVMRYRKTGRAEEADAIERALTGYEEGNLDGLSESIRVPERVTEAVGRFLGLLIGDGHVPSNSRHVGFTSGSKAHAEEFAGLVEELFGVDPTVERQGDRWRVYAYSKNLLSLLVDEFDLPTGSVASEKTVPEAVLSSPKSVVAEFLRGLFDADGYAGERGVILSTKSEEMSKLVQLLLTNFGALSRRREQSDGCYHVHLTGRSANVFAAEIGFGYDRKADELAAYLDELEWFETESWTDEIESVSRGTGTVYDISVEETHRYAAAGLVNHNSYWESTMMGDEHFAGEDEFLTYADHQSRVLGSPGLNPYKLGMELWEYVENTTNRREVIERLLRVRGITWRNFHDAVDFDEVLAELAPPPEIAGASSAHLDALAEMAAAGDDRVDGEAVAAAREGAFDADRYPWKLLTHEGLVQRHYSLCKRQHRGFLRRVSRSELERAARYLFDDERYDSVEDALADVDYGAGWDRMREIRESHNDVTFLDAFLTEEFVGENDYFTYEYSRTTDDFRVTSDEYEDVKKKLLLQFTNFGKPTVAVYDGNFDNRGELLLGHQYNGVMLDVDQAERVLERVHDLWGRPVNLMTIVKEYDDHDVEVARRRGREPSATERGIRIRYDGETFEEHDLDPELAERISAAGVDYDTKPDDWLA